MRVQLVTSTFDQAARDGCFTRTLHRLLRDGIPSLSHDYLQADDQVIGRIAGVCKTQDPPRTLAIQGDGNSRTPGFSLDTT
ncbi:hypothetical protein N865_21700 [Intrasporangium oryzae NRRL B-24470]|uniref:Uncharacterized protein n=1 Tax=Intrasporangium oryzae NRRL B-24470 TaxID=1386089 RepID=W9G2X9_9MICO|nr:hypothetical protein [Intrasporangium oryzae]EWS99641.1 hypothetical protein N865_21700 [Intrasporangium oryzae NRRL B-24470]